MYVCSVYVYGCLCDCVHCLYVVFCYLLGRRDVGDAGTQGEGEDHLGDAPIMYYTILNYIIL